MRRILSALLLGTVAVLAAENQIGNAGFADGLTGWAPFGSEKAFAASPEGLQFTTDPAGDNIHLDQTPAIEPNTVYRATVEIRAQGQGLQPTLRIAGMDWSTVAETTGAADGEWHALTALFYSSSLTQVRYQLFGAGRGKKGDGATGTTWFRNPSLAVGTVDDIAAFHSARITVNPGATGETVSPLFFGVNSLFWITDDAARADGKIAANLKDMGCTLVRFPGGEVADNYHWQTNRLDNIKDFPGEDGPDQMDFDEFMVWLRTIGAEPICVVNLESSYLAGDPAKGVQEAADWVRYANVTKGYGVKYWEIGNETDLLGTRYPLTAEEYGQAVARFSLAMKTVDPTIQIGALGPFSPTQVAPLDRLSPEKQAAVRALRAGERRTRRAEFPPEVSGKPWWPTVCLLAKGRFDFAIIHRYDNSRTEFPPVFVPPLDLAEPVRTLDQYLREQCGHEVPLALTEWNVWSKAAGLGGIGHALTIAEQVGNYLSGGIDLANFWPMRYPHGKAKNDFFRGLLDYDTKDPRPAFEVLKLIRHHAAGHLVPVETGNDQLYAFATRDGTATSLFVVNRLGLGNGIAARIEFPGATAAQAQCLTGDEATGTVQVADHAVERDGSAWTCLLPPRSFTVLAFTAQE